MEDQTAFDIGDKILRDSLRPMEELIDVGVLYMLNRDYFIPNGKVLGIYISDEDPQLALGWVCLPLEVAREMDILPSIETQNDREAAFNEMNC